MDIKRTLKNMCHPLVRPQSSVNIQTSHPQSLTCKWKRTQLPEDQRKTSKTQHAHVVKHMPWTYGHPTNYFVCLQRSLPDHTMRLNSGVLLELWFRVEAMICLQGCEGEQCGRLRSAYQGTLVNPASFPQAIFAPPFDWMPCVVDSWSFTLFWQRNVEGGMTKRGRGGKREGYLTSGAKTENLQRLRFFRHQRLL